MSIGGGSGSSSGIRNGVPSGNTPDEPPQPDFADLQEIPLELDFGEAPAVGHERLAPGLDVPLEVAILLLKMLRLEEQPFGPDDAVMGRHGRVRHNLQRMRTRTEPTPAMSPIRWCSPVTASESDVHRRLRR